MEAKKRIKFKEGSIVKVPLSTGKITFGRLLPGFHIGLYDYIVRSNKSNFSIEEIITKPINLYVRIYKDAVTRGVFEIIGFKELSQEDIDLMPPHFSQDLMNLKDCVIYYEDGSEKKVSPKECIGLEGPVIWDAEGLIDRIKDRYFGKKNFYEEFYKVILSEKDPRYNNPDVRWSKKEGRFLAK